MYGLKGRSPYVYTVARPRTTGNLPAHTQMPLPLTSPAPLWYERLQALPAREKFV